MSGVDIVDGGALGDPENADQVDRVGGVSSLVQDACNELLPGAAITDRWQSTNTYTSSDLTQLQNSMMWHPAYTSRSPDDRTPASLRTRIRIACAPLPPDTPPTSLIRAAFLAFLGRPEIMGLITELTGVTGKPGRRGTSAPGPASRPFANRLVGIQRGCLKTRTLYDEATAWPHQEKIELAASHLSPWDGLDAWLRPSRTSQPKTLNIIKYSRGTGTSRDLAATHLPRQIAAPRPHAGLWSCTGLFHSAFMPLSCWIDSRFLWNRGRYGAELTLLSTPTVRVCLCQQLFIPLELRKRLDRAMEALRCGMRYRLY